MRKVNWLTPLAIAAGAVLLWFVLFPPGDNDAPYAQTTPQPGPGTSVATQPSMMPTADDGDGHPEGIDGEESPYETPSHEGGENPDYTHDEADQAAAVDVSVRFIAGWLNPDPAERRAQLEPIAAGDLVDQLSQPGLRIWETMPQGEPTITNQSGTAATTEQPFIDGRSVAMLLLFDPTIETRWTVVDIQPVKES